MNSNSEIKRCIAELTSEMAEKINSKIMRRRDMGLISARSFYRAEKIEAFTDRERISLQALVAWAAVTNNLAEDKIRAWTAAMFEAPIFEYIDRGLYSEVVAFLVDFSAWFN